MNSLGVGFTHFTLIEILLGITEFKHRTVESVLQIHQYQRELFSSISIHLSIRSSSMICYGKVYICICTTPFIHLHLHMHGLNNSLRV